ncbi:hypothetical protein Agub_g2688, partial [Astrephomene gubernaculifera]
VRRLLTAVEATRADPRVMIVTDPRVFFTLYPAVQAAGLRCAHLPQALTSALLKSSSSSAAKSATGARLTGGGGGGKGDTRNERDVAGGQEQEREQERDADTGGGEDAAAELQRLGKQVEAAAQPGSCLFVSHGTSACAAFPLSAFHAAIIMAPDRPSS